VKRGAIMGLFQHNEEEKRSIDDILTPKYDDGDEAELVGEEAEEVVEDVPTEETAEEKVEEKKLDIKVETPEEVSFNALTCFGWSETKTPKWLIKCAHFWYGAMSFFWFVFGALTFAPIIFMQKKTDVLFKSKFKSFIVSCAIYAIFVALIVILFASNRSGNPSEAVSNYINIKSIPIAI
jgi:hypothetical protein